MGALQGCSTYHTDDLSSIQKLTRPLINECLTNRWLSVVVCSIFIVFICHFPQLNTNFMIVGCSPTSNYAIFFRTASEIFFRYKTILPTRLKHSKNFVDLTFRILRYFSTILQAKTQCENCHILSCFDTCPVRSYPQAQNWSYPACYFKFHQISKIYSQDIAA